MVYPEFCTRNSAGNDTLQGGPGNDYLDGGVGNDEYLISFDRLHAVIEPALIPPVNYRPASVIRSELRSNLMW